jgi:hypothetical protein
MHELTFVARRQQDGYKEQGMIVITVLNDPSHILLRMSIVISIRLLVPNKY